MYLKHLWRGLPTVIFNQMLHIPRCSSQVYNKSDTSSFFKLFGSDIVQVLSVSSHDISYLSSLLHLPDSSLSQFYFVDPLLLLVFQR